MKNVVTILLALVCLAGCSKSSEIGEDINTVSSEGIAQVSDTQNEEDFVSDDNKLTDYESLIYNGVTKIRVSDLCELEVPESVAKTCISIEDAMEKMKDLNGSTDMEDITPEFWSALFSDSSYFVNYYEAAMLMSEELLLQINLFQADSGTPAMLNVLSDTEDVSTFNSIFGKLVATSLYGSKGFSMLSRAGEFEEGDVTLLSFIFACETSDFSLTDGYFGYFIVGYSSKSNIWMTCLISGLSGISDPELVGAVYNSFNSPSDDTEYWGILERSSNE